MYIRTYIRMYVCIRMCIYVMYVATYVCMENYVLFYLPIWTYRESDFDEHPKVNTKLEMILWCINRYIYKRDPCMSHMHLCT